jgi:hypothetical protein
MALPETIPVRYTEEEAEYLSVRPVVRQTFRLDELLDMLLGITGKDVPRLRQILRAGTVVFHFYRYWWQGFEADAEDLAAVLARFPDADPTRAFRAEECTAVLLESGGDPPRHSFEIGREAASRKGLFRSQSFWDCLMELGRQQPPSYQEYSYLQHADLYQLLVSSEQVSSLVRDASRLAPRELRGRFGLGRFGRGALGRLAQSTRVVFVCPRPA